jgi:DNA-directed RNA polymerase specialized sigma24 family protein
MRRTTSYINPEYFDSGEIGRQTADEDKYFASDSEPSVRIVLDNFVKFLPEYRKTAVEMCVMAGLTYEEAADEISLRRGIKTDKKTVWRWARAGLEDLKLWLSNSPWVSAATNGKIPVERLDELIPISLPWEDEDGEL